jgi:hypothetical protein
MLLATKSFEKQLKKGYKTELLIEKSLHSQEWSTIPIYRLKYDPENNTSVAPKLLISDSEGIVLPDILAYKDSYQIWVECKHEEGASWTWTLQRFDHGFSKRLYDSYLRIEQITTTPVWIIFHEVNQLARTVKDFGDMIVKGISKDKRPIVNPRPKDVLRGRQLSKISKIRSASFSGRPYIYFPQSELLELGTIDNPDFSLLYKEE